jgi:hypothetical protein
MVVIRLPNDWPTTAVNDLIGRSLEGLLAEDLASTLAVIEPDRIRLRRSW